MQMKIAFVPSVIAVLLAVARVDCDYYSNGKHHGHPVEKVTHLHFFLHDILSGVHPTAVKVAQSNLSRADTSPTPFSSVFVIDDHLREGPEPNSKAIGNAQGMYISSSQDLSKFSIILLVDFAFTTGEFNGSSISVFSRNPVTEAHQEVAVVGGRGKFRLARGFAEIKTSYFNATNGDAILEYNVTVLRYLESVWRSGLVRKVE